MTPEPPRKAAGERMLERTLFAARWLIAPFYLGLVAALAVLLIVFVRKVLAELGHVMTMSADDAILMALSLIDLSLAGNLLLIVIYSGYENFVSRIDIAHEDRPDWMGTIDFAELKSKLIVSIVAISAVALLKSFMALDATSAVPPTLGWQVGIHLTFVVSGLLLAVMDALKGRKE